MMRRLRTALFGAVLLSVLWAQAVWAAPSAHNASNRFTLDYWKLDCIEETDWDQGTSSDEPYVIFFVANTRTGSGLVMRTRVYAKVDTGDSRTNLGEPRLWALNGSAAAITNASDMIVLAIVMENDASEAREIVTGLQPIMLANLLAYMQAGLTRATIVSNLRQDMDNAIDMVAVASGPTNPDDRLGNTLELPLTHANLDDAAAGNTVNLSLRFRDSGEDATYRVWFQLRGS